MSSRSSGERCTASVVDLRVTQVVNGVRGAHAVLADNALR
jgi:hypothetical protein